MTPDRLEEIQKATAYPDSQSVKSALFTVWHETQLANEEKMQALELEMQGPENLVQGRDAGGVMRYKNFIAEIFAFIGSLVFIYFLSTAPSFGLAVTAIAVWFTWYVLIFIQVVSSRKIKTSIRTTLALDAVMALGGVGLLYAGDSAGEFPILVTCIAYVGLCYFITNRLIFGAKD